MKYLLFLLLALPSLTFAIDTEPLYKIEADVLKTVPKKRIVREKDKLTITLKNKKKKVFKDNLQEGTESHIRSILMQYIPKHDVAVVQQLFYEGGQFLVVSLNDGKEIVTPTQPVWSPDKSNFISVNDDESGYTDNLVSIGSCKKKKCTKVFSEKTASGGEKWLDDKSVEFEKRKFDAKTGASEVEVVICKIDKKVSCVEKPSGP